MSEPNNSLARHEYEVFLDQLPADWEQKEIAQIGNIVGGGTPSRDVPSFWRGSIPWVTPGEISGEGAKLLHDTNDHISASGLACSGANLLPAGALLVTTRATLGARAINAVPMATNQGFKSVLFKKPEEASYYFHLFEKVKRELVRRASGTTFLEISGAEFGCIKVPSPLTREKLRISEILDTLDSAIHETKAIIAKLKVVKQGLLHDLLTRGIDANGELRPPQTEAPHLYKESPLGWIPKEWDVRPLSEYTASEITYGIVQAGPHIPNGVPYIRTGDMSGDYLNRETMLCTSRRIASSYKRSEVHTGDIVMAIRATVGKVLPVTNDLNGANLTQGTAKISPNARTDENFLLWAIRHSRVQKAIQHEIKGTTFAEITLGALRQVPVAAPLKINEGKEIGKRLTDINELLRGEQEYLAKVYAEKSGLMDDLLTGRVRVTPLL